MKSIQDKIKKYNETFSKSINNKDNIEKILSNLNNTNYSKQQKRISYMEFINSQSKYLDKRWWLIQLLLVTLTSFLLKDSYDILYMKKVLTIGAPLFVILILPEIWKNKNSNSLVIESSTYYSIRDIYFARILWYITIDLFFITLFYFFCNITFKEFIINFMVPVNICGSICFLCVTNNKYKYEHVILFFIIWTVIWLKLIEDLKIYYIFIKPFWIFYFIFSIIFLLFSISKVLQSNYTVNEEAICY